MWGLRELAGAQQCFHNLHSGANNALMATDSKGAVKQSKLSRHQARLNARRNKYQIPCLHHAVCVRVRMELCTTGRQSRSLVMGAALAPLDQEVAFLNCAHGKH